VERRDLLALLDQAEAAQVVTISAGAGFGKSTLLAQWVDRWRGRGGDAVWVTVPHLGDSLDVAMRIAGQVECGDAVGPLPTAYDDATWSSVTLPRLRDCLSTASAPLLVALDDVMNLTDQRADELFETLATGLMDGSQLAVTTRGPTPLALRRLRTTGRTVELGPTELAMTSREAGELLETDGVTLSPTEVTDLVGRTEGWPVGIFLMGRALASDPDHLDVEGRPGLTPGWITDYLHDEFLDGLDEKTADLLMHVCVLDVLDGDTCDAVSSLDGSLARLRELAVGNSLIMRTNGAGEQYRFHQLFAEFLRGESRARSTATFQLAHRRAFEWFLAKDDIDQAAIHGREMGDDRALGHMVWAQAWIRLTKGVMPEVRRWLGGMDDDRLSRDVGLALASFYCTIHEGDTERTRRFSSTLEEWVGSSQLSPFELAHCQVALAVVGTDGLDAIVGQTSQALEVLRPASDPWATVALFLRGVAQTYLGRPAEAQSDLLAGLALCHELGVVDMRAHCLAALAGIHLASGQLPDALRLADEARSMAYDNGLENIPAMSPVFTASAAVLVAGGRREEASTDAVRALRLMALMETIAPWHAVAGRLTLAQVFWSLGDGLRARVLLDESRELTSASTESPVLAVLAEQVEGLVESAPPSEGGASLLTTAELKVLQYLPTHLSFPEIGGQLYLSRHTIKSQAVSAYRKLGVSSRSEAVARARELGLLPSA
jgi:LuxR family maltose regulon positive regulatory protein